MKAVNIHVAKTHLSSLVEEAVQGKPFIIAKAGKPLVKVVALGSQDNPDEQRVGFMAGQITMPQDFDQLASDEIIALFEGEK